jgi:putative nucleotidyltransferase with HDIG domain
MTKAAGGPSTPDEDFPYDIRESGLDFAIPPCDPRILVIDDDPAVRRMLSRLARRRGYSCATAASLQKARGILERESCDLLFLDLHLPDGSGIGFLEEGLVSPSETLVAIISGERRLESAVQAMRKGAWDYLAKPFTAAEFGERLEKAAAEWRSRHRYHYYLASLERMVRQQTEELRRTHRELGRIHDMTVLALGAALDLRYPETEEHCRRVARNSVLLGRELGLSSVRLRNLKWGAYLHDIGKIGIPDNILTKPSALTAQEMEIVRSHPIKGYFMISSVEFLKNATDVVLHHHEKYDGSGYPYGLKDREIPLAARIFAVTDAFDAVTFDRPYRRALPYSAFLVELESGSGRHFDPDIVESFRKVPQDAWEVESRSAGSYEANPTRASSMRSNLTNRKGGNTFDRPEKQARDQGQPQPADQLHRG